MSCLHNQEDHTVDKRSQEMQTSLNMLETEDSAEGITYKNWSFVRLPRDEGISPDILLFDKFKVVKFVKFPNSLGIPPVMPFPGKLLHDEWNKETLVSHLRFLLTYTSTYGENNHQEIFNYISNK